MQVQSQSQPSASSGVQTHAAAGLQQGGGVGPVQGSQTEGTTPSGNYTDKRCSGVRD